MERLKRNFFHTLAIGIKLSQAQQGRNIPLDVNSLYEVAKDMPWGDWQGWLEGRVEEIVRREQKKKTATLTNVFFTTEWGA
jgi:hypothetical protein